MYTVKMVESIRVLLALVVLTAPTSSTGAPDFYEVVLTIPNSEWKAKHAFLCTSLPVEADQYVTKIDILAPNKTLHHITVAACEIPTHTEGYWDCSHVKGNSGCNSSATPIYTTSKDAPGWVIPDGFGMPTGDVKGYLLLQVHAHMGFDPPTTSEFSYTGAKVTLRRTPPAYDVAMARFSSSGYVPSHVKDFTADVACTWDYPLGTPILGFGIHVHKYGKAYSAYVYSRGKWTELGRVDPDYPEVVINIYGTKKVILQRGDILASRCTVDNPTDKEITFGMTSRNQMCNLYLLYGIPHANRSLIHPISCTANVQNFHWENLFLNIPENSKVPDPQLMESLHLYKIVY